MTTSLHGKRGVLGVAATAAAMMAIAAPGASASGIDPSIYDPGLPAGTVEHGVESFTITGSPNQVNDRIEYWVTNTRFSEVTTNAKTGAFERARLHDEHGTTYITLHPAPGMPAVQHFDGPDSIPGPGWPAPYNKKLLAGTAGSTLRAIGPVTIAGIGGTKYELVGDGEAGSHSYISLDAGAQPLQRESTAPNGQYGTFDQTETLLSRQFLPAQAAAGHLSGASFKTSLKSFKAKAAKVQRAAQQHR
jgi:hypothetical protein